MDDKKALQHQKENYLGRQNEKDMTSYLFQTRYEYKALIKELKYRFCKVQIVKIYGVQFSHRNQRSDESPEPYAADLKHLYDKAHSNRGKVLNRKTYLDDSWIASEPANVPVSQSKKQRTVNLVKEGDTVGRFRQMNKLCKIKE